MKKSIAFMISVVLTTTPYAGAETLPNDFSITTIQDRARIKPARHRIYLAGAWGRWCVQQPEEDGVPQR